MNGRLWRILGACALLVVGCHKVLGHFEVDDSKFEGAQGGSGSTPVEGICEDGERQCAGPVLQSCNAARNGWTNEIVCATAALCNATAGACSEATCDADTFRCNDAVLQECNGTRDGWLDRENCISAAHCSAAGNCMDAPPQSAPA
jgi:hypothetical protein